MKTLPPAPFLVFLLSLFFSPGTDGETVALWLFDEQVGIYPSCALDSSSANDYPLVLGPGGRIVKGKFGNALEARPQPPIDIPFPYPSGSVKFGLLPLETPEGRTVAPMNWANANFCGLMTSGENHLRKEIGFVNATRTRLNLGAFDWTVEFWFRPSSSKGALGEGVVFEIGEGLRGENDHVTRLVLNADRKSFSLFNQPSGRAVKIPSRESALRPGSVPQWHHLAFVYEESKNRLSHFVDGKRQGRGKKIMVQALPTGEEAYFSVGRDGLWERPLPGALDELRFSAGVLYREDFAPPDSFAPVIPALRPAETLLAGPPLLFGKKADPEQPLNLGSRKHLFIDDAFVEEMENITFEVNPPRPAERVIDAIKGGFRKHLTVIEDENGLIRIYNSVHDDYLAVRTSRDGIHFEMPDLGHGESGGLRNIVLPESTGVGTVFIDPNAAPGARWKYLSGYHDRAVYLYFSPDGWSFSKVKTGILPFRSGSQSMAFYDDQRQIYVAYHRSDYGATPAGKTQREFVRTETENVAQPWPFQPVTQAYTREVKKRKRLKDLNPWYLDNGPLTPGGFGTDYPTVFAPDDALDPPGTDIYVPKSIKYPWAPDTYLAFPTVYFHYEGDGPETRHVLAEKARGRGSGPIESQLSVSRDGIAWQRYPRPAYIGIGKQGGRDIHQVYIANGMVRRGREIWQYYFGTVIYHSSWSRDSSQAAVYRVVQRLDGFVSANSPYDKIATLKTRPFRFTGNRLLLNIDTDATGYAQVGFLDEKGDPIPGFSVDTCVYINGDFIDTEVEWLGLGKDVSSLQNRTVQLVFRMRGTRLFALQFVNL